MSSSYRPISLLPVVAKLVERVIQKQVLKFFIDSKQLNENNNVYRAHHSTVTALLQITDTIHRATDENTIATVMTMDESAAFDCISHNILDHKIELYNFSKETRAGSQTSCFITLNTSQ